MHGVVAPPLEARRGSNDPAIRRPATRVLPEETGIFESGQRPSGLRATRAYMPLRTKAMALSFSSFNLIVF